MEDGKTKLKLCIVSTGDYFSNYGGGEVYVRNIVDGFHSMRFDRCIEMFVLQSGQKLQMREHGGIKIYDIGNQNDAYTVLSAEHPDIVHANGLFETIVPTCRLLGIKCVVTIHDCMYICPVYTHIDYRDRLCSKPMAINNCLRCYLKKIKFGKAFSPVVKNIADEKYIQLGRWLDTKPFVLLATPIGQAALKIQNKVDYWNDNICSADRVILLSNRMVRAAISNGLNPSKIKLIPNGIPEPDVDTAFPSAEKSVKFYYVGRVCYSKGVHILLSAFKNIKLDNCELHIIGDDNNDYSSRLKKKHSSDKRIVWHGVVEHNELMNLAKHFHVMVHPSIGNECCPLSIAEALSIGKCVIATKCGGPEDQIIDGENGWLVEPNNVGELTKAMSDFIEKPSSPRMIKYVTLEEHLGQLMQTYEEIV